MAKYSDYIAQGKTPQQIQDAITKKYGADNAITKKFTTGKYQLPGTNIRGNVDTTLPPGAQSMTGGDRVISASVGTGSPKKNIPTNIGVVPPNNSAPVIQPTEKGNFGDMSKDNVHAPGFENTGVAYQERAKQTADQLAKVATEEGAAKQKIIDQKNQGALGKSKAQETELQRIAKEYADNTTKSRGDADKIFQRQEQIAGRQANMAAAQAGESGLVMSAGVLQDIKDDTIAKYGSNIANAEQFRAQTNMTLNDALKNTGLQIFEKQANIDLFQKSLTDEAFAPVLNAVTEAAKGNKDAINDVDKYYKEYIQKKAQEEYTRTMASESRTARDKEWFAPGMTAAKRIALLSAYAKEDNTPISNLDAALGLMTSYPDFNQAQIIAKLAKIAAIDTKGSAAYMQYLMGRAKDSPVDPAMEAYGKELMADTARSEQQIDLSVTDTKNTQNIVNANLANENPLNLSNAKNREFYDELTPTERAAFNTTFKSVEGKYKNDRQKAFDEARRVIELGKVKPTTPVAPTVAPKVSRAEQEKKDTQSYTYKGENYTLSQVQAAMLKGTPAQRAQMNREFKLSYDVNTGKPSIYQK